MPKQISLNQQIAENSAGLRLDQAAVELFPDYSRGRLQQWIKQGELTVDGKRAKPSARVLGGEILRVEAQLISEGEVEPQDIPLDILFSDDHLLVLNKPVGLVIHPAAGNWDGTLQNALLSYDSELDTLPTASLNCAHTFLAPTPVESVQPHLESYFSHSDQVVPSLLKRR